MRHQDPRITTEVYGHLAPAYLKKEIDRLRFEPPPAAPGAAGAAIQAPSAVAASAAGSRPTNGPSSHAAGGASEPPQPAASGTVLRLAAPLGTHLVLAPRSPMHPRPGEEELERILAELSCRGERI
jgi:hypothetical protein